MSLYNLIFRVIVCPAFGLNSTKSREIGYFWPIQLFSGSIDSEPDTISWKGIQSKNLSWQEIQDCMFPDFETLREDYIFWDISKENVQEMHLLPFMKCLEVKNISKIIEIGSSSAMNVYLTDAKRQTYYRNARLIST